MIGKKKGAYKEREKGLGVMIRKKREKKKNEQKEVISSFLYR